MLGNEFDCSPYLDTRIEPIFLGVQLNIGAIKQIKQLQQTLNYTDRHIHMDMEKDILYNKHT